MENNMEVREGEIEIDLRELFLVLWRKAFIIVCAMVVFGAAAFGYTKFMATPMYESSSMIYILSKATDTTSLSDFQLSAALTADYELLATSGTVLNEVIDTLDLDISYNQLLSCVDIENPTGTHALRIKVSYPDNKQAMVIANELAVVVSEQVAKLMDTEMPITWETATIAETPSSPSLGKNMVIGMLLGMFLSAGIIVVLFLLDDTIKDESDVAKYLGKNVLATLPKDQSTQKNSNKATRTNRPRSNTQQSVVRTEKKENFSKQMLDTEK